VLTDDERELGVVCVDVGAGCTDVAIFAGGSIRHTAVIPIAGDLITSDIAMALRTPTMDAEDIKVAQWIVPSSCWPIAEQQIEVPGLATAGRACSASRRWPASSSRVWKKSSRWFSRSCGIPATKRCCHRAWC
jgi:cell division protein FtsA